MFWNLVIIKYVSGDWTLYLETGQIQLNRHTSLTYYVRTAPKTIEIIIWVPACQVRKEGSSRVIMYFTVQPVIHSITMPAALMLLYSIN